MSDSIIRPGIKNSSIFGGVRGRPASVNRYVSNSSFSFNEPGGYTTIADTQWSSLTEDGWYVDGGSASLLTNSDGPESPPDAIHVVYPVGYPGGSGPVSMEHPQANSSGIYYRLVFKHSSNWQPHPSQINKMGFVWIHDNPCIILMARGSSLPMRAEIYIQNTADIREGLPNNINSGSAQDIPVGQWHTMEVHMVANTAGVSNGIAKLWLNGVQLCDHSDVQYSGPGEATLWQWQSLYPIWGGVGSTVSEEMYFDVDHIYISKSP